MSREVVNCRPNSAAKCPSVQMKSRAQICSRFLVPTIVGCLVFVAQFAADLVVAVQHIREQNVIWGGITLAIIYAPALAYFFFTISRPDWWMTDSDKSTRGVVVWFLSQILRLVAFPFFALYRYATQIVLSVDAILITGEERQKTLNELSAPAAIEFYFFLQAWFQAIPQALFQSHLCFRDNVEGKTIQSLFVQIFCIIMSITVVAKTTTSFQRYESQRVSGRKLPWAMWYIKYDSQELKNLDEKQPLKMQTENANSRLISHETVSENKEPEKRVVLERENSSTPPLPPKNLHILPPAAPLSKRSSTGLQSNSDQKTSENEDAEKQKKSNTPPLPPKNIHILPPPAPLRRITTIAPLPIPDMPAPPRPDSFCSEPEQPGQRTPRYANSQAAEMLNQVLESPIDISTPSLHLPKRLHASQGLDEDDSVGAVLSFAWWFLFIFVRVLSIVIFFEFFPYYLGGIIGIHYVVMLAYLFYQSKFLDIANVFVNVWLGLIFIFSVIEYRIKFSQADVGLFCYYLFVIIQNVGMNVGWYATQAHGFWLEIMFHLIVVATILCVVIAVIYFAMVKPKKRRIYVT